MTEEKTPPIQGSILDRLDRVEKKAGKRGEAKAGRQVESAIAAAIRESTRKGGEDPALEDFREELFGELKKLIPVAIAQARGQAKGRGKKEIPPRPALLRILTRFSR